MCSEWCFLGNVQHLVTSRNLWFIWDNWHRHMNEWKKSWTLCEPYVKINIVFKTSKWTQNEWITSKFHVFRYSEHTRRVEKRLDKTIASHSYSVKFFNFRVCLGIHWIFYGSDMNKFIHIPIQFSVLFHVFFFRFDDSVWFTALGLSSESDNQNICCYCDVLCMCVCEWVSVFVYTALISGVECCYLYTWREE